ncbi:hypothetical protein [Paenibacillus alginolyticus]|uniref:Uncharacterized protein n=2 Tax=Paenibacillus alginolyticus TaxID=59839 RepID=A0ABT4GQ96_9BACL|nr:hypothetical protein [Paenibacillus alginolyticus]MCY9698393.1 hypothetical protein [Paenibacillus alginolyticus]
MGIYGRDYTQLTIEEMDQWKALREQEIVKPLSLIQVRKSLFREYPKAVRHYMSLFPNHYMDIEDLKDETELNELAEMYLEMLDTPGTPERTVLNWLRENKAYFIIASILQLWTSRSFHISRA